MPKTDDHKFVRASKYIERIRHPAKKQYARDYYQFLRSGQLLGQEADYDRDKLSYMAAQAVRMNLDEIMQGEGP